MVLQVQDTQERQRRSGRGVGASPVHLLFGRRVIWPLRAALRREAYALASGASAATAAGAFSADAGFFAAGSSSPFFSASSVATASSDERFWLPFFSSGSFGGCSSGQPFQFGFVLP